MAARKAVRSLTYGGISLPIVSGPPTGPASGDKTLLAAFGDTSKTAVVSECLEYGEFTVKCLDEGGTPPNPGTQVSLVAGTGYGSGAGATATRTWSRTCEVVSVTPATVEVAGNREAAFEIVLTPVGGDVVTFGDAATTTTTG